MRAHDAVYTQEYEADLKHLLEQTLKPYSEGAAITIGPGEKVLLTPSQAMSLSLILHELATNAVKYGALSTAQGKLAIRWKIKKFSERRLQLTWRESGGPPVTPPTTSGFGTRLIEFSVRRELGGRVELNYAPKGLAVEIATPL